MVTPRIGLIGRRAVALVFLFSLEASSVPLGSPRLAAAEPDKDPKPAAGP